MLKYVEALCKATGLYKLDKIYWLRTNFSKVGINRPSYLFATFLSFWAFHVITEYGTSWMSLLIGFFYPAYMTLKMVGLEGDERDEEAQFWLKYWLIYGCINIIESIMLPLLLLTPHYYVIKIVLLIWLINPETQGASRMYDNGLRIVFKKYEPTIDEKVEMFKKIEIKKNFTTDFFQRVRKETVKKVANAIAGTA